jgi:hypothetical protein
MDRERAETFLRLLAEAELHRATARPGDRAAVAGCASRVMRVAGALTAVRVLGDEVTGPVLDDFELALGTRRVRSPAGYGRGLRSWMGSASRGASAVPDVAVPVGQVIPVHGEEVTGEGTLGRPEVTVSPVTRSPGEQLLNNIAMRLLATGAVFPQFVLILLTEMALERPGPLPDTADGLGDVIAALQASGALPPRSQVPGQLAALCARLDVTGHGITVPPVRDLPEPWLSVLTQHERATARTAPVREGCAAVAAALPDLDGTRLSILGLTSSADGTMLHAHGSGLTHHYYGWPEKNLAPTIWIHDSRGRCHATRTDKYHEGDVTMHLQVVPPVSPRTDRIGILLARQSAEVRATLPLRWQ